MLTSVMKLNKKGKSKSPTKWANNILISMIT